MNRNTLALVTSAAVAAMAGIAPAAGQEPMQPTLQGITVQHQPMPYATATSVSGGGTRESG